MNRVYLFLFFLLSLSFYTSLYGQNQFHIDIKTSKSIHGGSIFFTYDNGRKFISKTIRIRQRNHLSDSFSLCYAKVNLKITSPKGEISKLSFFVNEDSCLIDISKSKLGSIIKEGLFKNAFYINQESEFYESFSEEFKEYSDFYTMFKKSNKDSKNKFTPILKEKQLNYFYKSFEYLLSNSASYFSFYYLSNYITSFDYVSIDSLILFYNQFPAKFKESSEGILLQDKLFAKKSISILKRAPELSVTLLNNKTYDIKPNNNNLTVLAFWASWCKPCINELKELEKLRQKYIDNISFVIVSLDNDTNACKKAIAGYHFNFLNSIDKNTVAKFGITYIPQCFLIGKNNQILYSSLEKNDNSSLQALKQKIAESVGY